MTLTAFAPTLTSRTDDSDDELCHLFCCDENLAYCGEPLDRVSFDELGEDEICVVCDDLDAQVGRSCGHPDCPYDSP